MPSWALIPLRNGKRLDSTTRIRIPNDDSFIGRRELLQGTWKACGCRSSERSLCDACTRIKQWAMPVVSREFLRISNTDKLEIKGMNAFQLLRIHGTPISANLTLTTGMRLTLAPPDMNDSSAAVMEYQVVKQDDETKQQEHVQQQPQEQEGENDTTVELKSTTTTQASPQKDESKLPPQHETENDESATTNVDHRESPHDKEDNNNEPSPAKNGTSTMEPPQNTPDLMKLVLERIEQDEQTWNHGEPAAKDGDEVSMGSNGDEREESIAAAVDRPDASRAEQPQGKQTSKELPKGKRTSDAHTEVVDLVSVASAESQCVFKLLFVHVGQGKRTIEIRSNVARSKGALVTDSLDEKPTHLIIDGNPSVGAVASELNFRNASALARYLADQHIETVKFEWIARSGDVLKDPTMQQLWHGLANVEPKESRKRHHSGDEASDGQKALRRSTSVGNNVEFPSNAELSKLFRTLSKLHEKCPLLGNTDKWKAYCFNKVSSRIKHLDFEIVDDPEVLARLKKVDGIGPKTVQKVKEYLRTGKIQRIEEFQTNPDRIAMKTMMDIWGVGYAKASELFNRGYRTIEDVRRDLKSGTLDLTRNQKIGVECYEEFLEHMSRKEVKTMGDIVIKAAQERYPKAEIVIMGSYRRDKKECGDIDLLITHPDYIERTPEGALGELVERLRRRGHIAYHLTHIAGMSEHEDSSQSSASQQALAPPPAQTRGYPTSSSYMGVFYSPLVGKKRRRIDIKFYPYRERIYASLYFTGNGWFNRSMRLWSKRVKKYHLNDHGLFPVCQDVTHVARPSERLPIEASTEREVFDLLGLVYKEPHERLTFDDVIPVDPQASPLKLTREEYFRELGDHDWTK